MQESQQNIITTYDMARDSLKIARQIRSILIGFIVSVFIAIGSICALMIL